MKGKKGILGSLFVMVASAIAIIIILGLFISYSWIMRKTGNVHEGVVVLEEKQLGISDVGVYLNTTYKELLRKRMKFREGINLKFLEEENEG